MHSKVVFCVIVALAALLTLTPRTAYAGCGMGNQCPVVDKITIAPSPAPPGQDVQVTCAGHDPDGTITKLTLSADGGLFGGASSIDLLPATAGPSASVQAAWKAPNVPGATYTITCVAWDNGGVLGKPTAGAPLAVSVPIGAAAIPPAIQSLTADRASLFGGQTATLMATATDPAGGGLTFVWGATCGTVTGTGPTAVFTAPAEVGSCTVTVTVTDAAGQTASALVGLGVVWARPGSTVSLAGLEPMEPARMATDAAGNVYVSDARARVVRVFTPLGDRLRVVVAGERPTAVAVAKGGDLLVADADRGSVSVIDSLGEVRRVLGIGAGEFQGPMAIAVDAASGRVYVADGPAGMVKWYDGAGKLAGSAALAGFPIGLAVEPATGELYVSDARGGQVLVYGPAGDLRRTIGAFGSQSGQLTRPGGLALAADGNLYVVDTFQARVAVFTQAGAFLAFVGQYGDGAGQMKVPTDVAADAGRRIVIANSQNRRLDYFDLEGGAVLPLCVDDSDCDGMPDSWELDHGLDPFDPTDAYADADHDGLVNVEEYRHGTDPQKADTDADGVPDGKEILAGLNPLDATDNRPVAVAAAAQTVGPTRVVLDASASFDPNGDPLAYEWHEAEGPVAVPMIGGTTSRAEAVLHAAGEYVFRVRVDDGKAASDWAEQRITVTNVAPTADPGPRTHGVPGTAVVLDGRFSSDANRDPLTYAWTQVAGPAVTLAGADQATPTFTPAAAGVYEFELAVSDGLLSSTPARVRAIVDAADDHVPVAVAPALVEATAGAAAPVDGTASLDVDGAPLTYRWEQLDGPALTFAGADQPVVSVTPSVPGVYRISLTVSDGVHDSVPQTSVIVATGPTDAPPRAAAGFDQRGDVLVERTLSCANSFDPDGQPVTCDYRQVGGVAVSLTPSDGGATFLPIDPGTYAFAVTARDPDGAGTSDDLIVVVDDPSGDRVPTAVITAAGKQAGEPLQLSGAQSHGALPLTGFAWTQVAGPPVLIPDARAAALTVVPPLAGNYAFELRVDDGRTRSPAARVDVAIGEALNEPPRARASGDQLGRPAEPVVLDGSASEDPEGAALTYLWEQVGGPLGATASADGPRLTVTAPSSGVTLRFRLTVSDGELSSAPVEMNLSLADRPLGLFPIDEHASTIALSGVDARFDGLRIDVPAASVAAPQSLALGAVTRPWYAAPDRVAHDDALFLGPVGAHFAAPLRVRLPLRADALLARGVTASQLGLARFDYESSTWLPVPNADIDLEAGTIAFDTDVPGTFQITAPAGWDAPETDGGAGAGGGGIGGAGTGGQASHKPTTGCSAHGAPSGPGAGAALLALVALLAVARRGRRLWSSVALVSAALAFGLSGTAWASDPPHSPPTLSQGCPDCHTTHSAPGVNLTSTAGIGNLCLSCHVTGGMAQNLPFSSTDQAVPGLSGTSHRWDANATNAACGALPPQDPAVLLRVNGGVISCSACHDQHSQTNAPFDPTAPASGAGRHFMRVADGSNQLCLDCHRSWNMSSVRTYTGAALSHPVQRALPAGSRYNSVPLGVYDSGTASAGSTTSTLNTTKAWPFGALVGMSVTFTSGANSGVTREITANTASQLSFGVLPAAPASGDEFEITGGAQVAAVAGAATGGSTTSLIDTSKDFSGMLGLVVRITSGADKNLVRTITSAGPTQIGFAALPVAVAAGARYEIDRDGNLSNDLPLLDGTAGSYTTGQVVCLTCHGVHFADSKSATHEGAPGAGDGHLLRRTDADTACNACHREQVHNSINTSSTRPAWGLGFNCRTCHQPHGTPNIYLVKQTISTPNGGDRAVDFRNTTGVADDGFASATLPGDGICEVCHTQTSHFRADGSGADQNHQNYADSGLDCMSCHPHKSGFKPACAGCHMPTPATEDYPGGGGAHAAHVTTLGYRCPACHNQAPHNEGDGTIQRANVEVAFAAKAFPGGTSESNGGTPAETYNGGDPTCQVGCHNPRPAEPAAETPNLDNQVRWTGGTQRCSSCHDRQGTMMAGGSVLGVTYTSEHRSSPSDVTTERAACQKCHDQASHTQGTVRLTPRGGSSFAYQGTAAELDPVCRGCHAGTGGSFGQEAPPNVVAGFTSTSGDFHGTRSGTGWGGTLKAPYARGAAPLPCAVCHTKHASPNAYLLRTTVNGAAVAGTITRAGVGAENLCRACHDGDYHAGCQNGCHAGDPVPPPQGCFYCHTHNGIENWPSPFSDMSSGECDHCHSGGWLPWTLTTDHTAPLITAGPSAAPYGSTATITWSTDEASSTIVEYSEGTSCCDNWTAVGGFATSHSLKLTGLKLGTTYSYRVRSEDAAHNAVVSPVLQFSTNLVDPPTVPTLIPQADIGSSTAVSVNLCWNASTIPNGDPIEYQAQVSTDPTFATVTFQSAWQSGTCFTITAQPGTDYSWRVSARDGAHTTYISPWSTAGKFGVSVAPPVPTLIDEPDLLSPTAPLVTLQWNPVTQAYGYPVQYAVEVSTSATFQAGTIVYSGTTWTSSTQVSISFATDRTYYWHVRARDQLHPTMISAYSASDTFVVTSALPPPAPVPTPEPDLAVAMPASITLQWSSVAAPDGDAVQYRAQLSTDAGFATITRDSGWISATSFALSISYAPQYYWRVMARDAVHSLHQSAWSSTDDFAVAAPPPVPTPVAQGSLSSTVPVSLSLSCGAVVMANGHPVEYSFEVATVSDFSALYASSGWISGTSATFTFAAGQRYYWRVRARDATVPALTSAWSATQSFGIVAAASPPAPVLVDQLDYNSGGGNTDITLQWSAVAAPDGDAVEYQVELIGNAGTVIVSPWGSATSFTANLPPQQIWSWQVMARDAAHTASESPWSAADTFADQYVSSCPFIYVWNGSEYVYATDIQGEILGLPPNSSGAKAVQLYGPSQVVLEGAEPTADNEYRVKVREALSEIDYFDLARLVVVDHPTGTRIVSSSAQGTYTFGYALPFSLTTIADPAPPVAARNRDETDALAALAACDGQPAKAERDALEYYTLEFDAPAHPEHAKLVIDGWSIYGATLRTGTVTQPHVEVLDPSGTWVSVRTFAPPAGDLKTLVVDLGGLLPAGHVTLRVHLGMRSGARWVMDCARLDDSDPAELTTTEVSASYAELRHRGPPTHTMASLGQRIEAIDDEQPDQPGAGSSGLMTRFGDVRDLLGGEDDMFVVMEHGDEVELVFPGLAPPAAGMTRTVMLKADVFYKGTNRTVLPLPFHGMTAYPYPATESYPYDAAHQQYLDEYNTRLVSEP